MSESGHAHLDTPSVNQLKTSQAEYWTGQESEPGDDQLRVRTDGRTDVGLEPSLLAWCGCATQESTGKTDSTYQYKPQTAEFCE